MLIIQNYESKNFSVWNSDNIGGGGGGGASLEAHSYTTALRGSENM